MKRYVAIFAIFCTCTLSVAAIGQTGPTERVSVDSSGTEANGSSTDPVISADGRFVDRSIVDEHAERTAFQCRRDGAIPVGLLAHVHVKEARGGAELGCKRLALVVEDVPDHDLRTLFDEAAHRRLAKPTSTPRNNRDLSRQTTHDDLPHPSSGKPRFTMASCVELSTMSSAPAMTSGMAFSTDSTVPSICDAGEAA